MGPFRCIATSATLARGEGDESSVARFAASLFGERFDEEGVILENPKPSPSRAVRVLAGKITSLSCRPSKTTQGRRRESQPSQRKYDRRLRTLTTLRRPQETCSSTTAGRHNCERWSQEIPRGCRQLPAKPSMTRRNRSRLRLCPSWLHFCYVPRTLQQVRPSFLPVIIFSFDHSKGRSCRSRQTRRSSSTAGARGDGALFEVGLCRECGQCYLVGKLDNGTLVEAVRDPGATEFGATFFLPLEDQAVDDEDADHYDTETYRLCVRCAEICRSADQLRCGHNADLLLQKQSAAEEREDQVPRCAVCGYQARDPVREVVHGTDGPHAVIATTLFQELPEGRKKVLAFADGRQEAAFFAWYLEDSYKNILTRNLLLKVVQEQAAPLSEGSSLRDLAAGFRDAFRQKSIFPPATSDLQLRREAWLALYREFLTDEPRISLEGVGLLRWEAKWPDWFQTPSALRAAPWLLSEREARGLVFVLIDSMRADRAVELRTESNIPLSWSDLLLQATQMRVSPAEKGRLRPAERKWAGTTGKRARFLARLHRQISPRASDQEAIDAAVRVLRDIWDSLRRCDEHAPTATDRLLIPVDDSRRLNPDWWRLQFVGEDERVFRCETCGRLTTVSVRDLCPRHRCPGSLTAIRRGNLERNHYRLLYSADLPGAMRVEEHTAQLDNEKAREFQRDFHDGKIHVLSCSTTFELGVDLGDLDTIFLRNVPPEAFNYAQRVGRSGRRSGHPGFAITYCKRGPHDLYHFAEPQRMLTGKIQPPVLALCNEKIVTRHIAAVALSYFFGDCKDRFSKVEGLFTDLTSPCGVRDFARFLSKRRSQIERTIIGILPEEMAARLGVFDGSWIDRIAGCGSRFALAEAEVASDYNVVTALKERAKNEDDFDTAKWAQRRAETVAKEEVLSFLSRKAVIPKYGFPVDVVELDTQRTQQSHEALEVSLQRDLSIAISEFAPTSKLVANKKEWTSYGLKRVAEKEWPRKRYSRCKKHNVFLQWEKGEPVPTMPCGCRARCYEYVIPQFGFVTDRDRPKDPKARPPKSFSTRPFFAGRRASEPAVIPMPAASPMLTVIKASPGLMVALCEGRRGEGFYVCGGCGAGFRNRPRGHKTPHGKVCSGTLEQVSLGHEFETDVLQLQFLHAPADVSDGVPFAFSLAYAIVEGAAEVLEVPSVDLSTTVTHSDQHRVPPIILYDNVPGGAGLVARLEGEEVLKDCLKAALKRVGGACGCAPGTSCYGCLRHYRNQFAHPYLARGPVHEYLESILKEWREGALA